MNTLSNPIGGTGASQDPLTERVRVTWMAGDFGRIARGYERGAAEFIARLGLEADERVLDVACGTGNLSIPAACTGAAVTGIDIAPNLIEQAQVRALEESLTIAFDVGDAEEMPYDDGAFDTVVTMFGTMFAARPERAAAELLRVTRPGGRIAMASWTPTGFIGEMFKITSRYAPPPSGVPSPLMWGMEEHVQARLGAGCASLTCQHRLMTFEFPYGPAEVVDQFRLFYGPTVRAFASLGPADQAKLQQELTELWWENNRASDDTTRVQSEYLEVVGVVR
jgi:SAM-dependent methyltransferase